MEGFWLASTSIHSHNVCFTRPFSLFLRRLSGAESHWANTPQTLLANNLDIPTMTVNPKAAVKKSKKNTAPVSGFAITFDICTSCSLRFRHFFFLDISWGHASRICLSPICGDRVVEAGFPTVCARSPTKSWSSVGRRGERDSDSWPLQFALKHAGTQVVSPSQSLFGNPRKINTTILQVHQGRQ